jgi:uncharacterized repeat protein (TIGR01451 family)
MSSVLAVGVAMVGVGADSAFAAAAVQLSVRTLAQPTNFAQTDNTTCEEARTVCDSYRVLVQNTGAVQAEGAPIIVTDVLPEGVKARSGSDGVEGKALYAPEPPINCPEADRMVIAGHEHVSCELEGTVPPRGEIVITVRVLLESSLAENDHLTNSAVVEGGGSSEATADTGNEVSTHKPPFAVQDFSFQAYGEDGLPYRQAGGHPFGVSVSFDFTSSINSHAIGDGEPYEAAAEDKDFVVDLPLGLVADPLAAGQCPESALLAGTGFTRCPTDSKVGVVTLDFGGGFESSYQKSFVSPVYNMTPEAGHPGQLGFNFLGQGIMMYANLVPTAEGYVIRVTVPGAVRASTGLLGASLSFFGNPSSATTLELERELEREVEAETPSAAFFANPVACGSAPSASASAYADSWGSPGEWDTRGTITNGAISGESEPLLSSSGWTSREAAAFPEGLSGCEHLQFDPTLTVSPETDSADTPSGYSFALNFPQSANVAPDIATPPVKDVTVTLPPGIAISPSAANGLTACTDFQIALSSTARGACPASSQIGEITATTPVLATPLTGRMYIASPECDPCGPADAEDGNLFRSYLELEGSGVNVKLSGRIYADPQNGQLTARFDDNPQLPVSRLTLDTNGGALAPLANPQTCGTFTTMSDLVPWSSPITANATPSSAFAVTGCVSPTSFTPGFTAGTLTPIGGGFSPFTLTISRHDGEQDLSGITVQTPAGLLGKIAGVPECVEAQANAGTCGPESQIGTTTAASGSGSEPLYLTGRVYLTGPYAGGPFGLSIIVPAVAGPFNLGTVVVRASIAINPHTAAITTTSTPLPQLIDGVPTRLQTVNVTLDRPGFIFNPTNCDAQAVAGTITSAQGAVAGVSSPFAAAGCANLPFKPGLTASTQGRTSKADGASLFVKVVQKPGEANIHKVDLELPKQLPSRLTTLQKACIEAQFNANPAGCPAASVIGIAKALAPVLNVPLTGPAYLVSHGGVAFPDVEYILQGAGVTIILDGKTQIKKGITYSHFETVPDAPMSSFETTLPEGPHSVLGTDIPASAKHILCGRSLTMPTTITGQNGAQIKQTTKIGVTGCAKRKSLTRAQKLANALKACRMKLKDKRALCEQRARQQYASVKAGAKGKHNNRNR